MKVVYDVIEDTGKLIPYLVPDETDTTDPEFDPTIGVPVVYNDVNYINLNDALLKIHNTFMLEGFFTGDNIESVVNKKRFIEVSRAILVQELLKYFLD